MKFAIADGKIIEKKELFLLDEYIDPRIRLSQMIWYGYGGIPLLSENLELLKKQADVLKIPFPGEFENIRELFRLIKRMLNKNKFYRSGFMNLQIIAGIESVHTLIVCTAFSDFTFPMSEEGLLVRFSSQKKYVSNELNRMAFFNERLWQSALAEIKGSRFSQSIILNDRDFVSESAYSNLYMIVDNELVTPSFQSGCHENAIRFLLLKATANLGIKITEKPSIAKDMLFAADEIFCVSEVLGVQWVLGVEEQRFLSYFSKAIHEELNVLLKQKAASNSF